MQNEHAAVHAIALVKTLIESGYYQARNVGDIVKDLDTLTAAIANLDRARS